MSDPKSKDQSFYLKLSDRPPTAAFTDLLETYSGVRTEDVSQHIEKVRDEAWDHYPFPSIGLLLFQDLGLTGDDLPKDDPEITQKIQTAYQTILSKLKNRGRFLDVGCMFAQDTRKLVYDGAPISSVYGCDIRGDYITHGYKLFRDIHIIPPERFFAADILDEGDTHLKRLEGKLDVINAVHLMHVFSIEDQRKLVRRVITMLKQKPGVMFTGRTSGNLTSGYHELTNAESTTKSAEGKIWEHTPESFKEMWKEESEAMNTQWDVDCWFWRFGVHTGKKDDPNWHRKEEHGICTFIATRL
ncbi:Methyltransferase trt5 [Lachnellula suecica]|uniref:Methyltransferase trt5 n=1 Tax=Lachnellula suecica TaxID=602035 RepID=A0A8T9CFK4_9HELO|nr:Methyltransferase trt5 [Lachnellula suecica]